jgi:cation diffusion facilitator family transporter
MLAEGFHSVADTGNGALLLLGRRRSKRPPDENHPLGHGQELYFWSFVVAILFFAVGGGFSIYEGVIHILHASPAGSPKWDYLILGIAAVIEGSSFTVAYHQFRKESKGRSLWKAVRLSKDPTTFTVLFEDGSDLLGLLIAFTGIWLREQFHNPVFDGGASILIGLMLTAVSMLLARESRGLLVGEGMNRPAIEEIRQIACSDPAVELVNPPLTVHFGPQTILLALEVQFKKGLSAADVPPAVGRIEAAVRQRFPDVRRIYIEAARISSTASSIRGTSSNA